MARKTIQTAEDKKMSEQAEQSNHPANRSENPISSDTGSNESMAYTRSRCGGALRTAREKLGLAIHDVASNLKISSRQIEAIEADQFANLPESTIVRGFIRNYAKLLKIEAEPLLDAYNVLVPSKEPLAFTIKPTSSMKVSSYKKPKTGRYIWLGLLILLVLASWLFYQNYIEKPSPTLPAGTEESEHLPQPALPAAERAEQSTIQQSPQQQSIDIALPPATTSELPQPDNSANAVLASSTLPTETVANAALPELQSAQVLSDMAKLEFNANQETWISIVDEAGKQIYNKTIFAGSRESVAVKLPINVTVGNAGGTTMSMNNKLVDLAPHTRSNVARIQVDKLELSQFE